MNIKKLIMTLSGILLMHAGLAAQPGDPEAFFARYEAFPLQDLYKAVYQDTFGPGHMIPNVESARNYLLEELESLRSEGGSITGINFYEPSGPFGNFYRVDLNAIRTGVLSVETLLRAFVASTEADASGVIPTEALSPAAWRVRWEGMAKEMGERLAKNSPDRYRKFKADSAALARMLSAEPDINPAVHHSEEYSLIFRPHYRIVRKDIFERDLKPILDTTSVELEGQGFRSVTTGQDYRLAGEIFNGLMRESREARLSGDSLTRAELMMLAARRLLETPYVAGTLDAPDLPKNTATGESPEQERLRVYLSRTDCILFVETCLNFASVVSRYSGSGDPGYADLAREVWSSRYRERDAGKYFNRIHYTTEWIREKEGRSLRDMTLELGGKVYPHPIHYMSRHPERYRQLAGTDSLSLLNRQKIRETEEGLNREPMTYIPKEKIRSIEGRIRNGDIICFVSNLDGLDIAHVAIAHVKDKVGFIHASQSEGKVVIDRQSIAGYALERNNLAGIKVVRPL